MKEEVHDLGEDNVLTRGKEKAVGMTRKFRGVESFSKTTQTNLASFMGQVEPVKAPELDSRVKRHLAGEDEGTERTSCPRACSCSPSLSSLEFRETLKLSSFRA